MVKRILVKEDYSNCNLDVDFYNCGCTFREKNKCLSFACFRICLENVGLLVWLLLQKLLISQIIAAVCLTQSHTFSPSVIYPTLSSLQAEMFPRA